MREPGDLYDARLRDRAVRAALGQAPFDVLVTGGRIADVITGVLRAADVGITGALIASVHAPGARADTVETVDAAGGIVAPGLIDAHMHVESSMVTPAVYAGAVLPRGVTTLVWDPHEFGNVHGLRGVRWAAAAARAAPMRILALAPSCVPSAPGLERSGADFGPDAVREMLSWPDIHGLAEVMHMQGVIDRDPRMAGIVQAGLSSGKLVCGHARGLAGPALGAYAAAGIASDHEITSAEDLLAKIRAGFTVEVRGSHDHLLPEFAAALNGLGALPPTVTLCTDDVFPDDLDACGGLDDVVRRMVRYGLPPLWALRAATLNAAVRLGRPDLGAVAPGRRADLAVFEDLEGFRATTVLANGSAVPASDGTAVANREALPGAADLPPLAPEDFRIRARGARVRVATIDQPRFTRWGEVDAEVRDGFVVPPDGCAMMSVRNRHAPGSPVRTAFLRGWGEWRGAFCTTVSHDSHNLTVFGGNERDMAHAANAVIASGGGLAVASGGAVRAHLPLPVAGLVSEAPLPEVAEGFRRIRRAMDEIVAWRPPYRVFKACFGASLACNAGPHLTDLGIVDASTGEVLETPVLGEADGSRAAGAV